MKKKDIESLIFIGLLLAAAIVIVLVTASIAAPAKRSNKAEKVDLNCITKVAGRPLQDCRIKSDKCLFEVDGTNMYELRPWEDCEE